jgi:preprotein translocase subunit SecB
MDASKQPGLQIDQVFLLQAHFTHREDALAVPPQTPIANLPLRIEAKVAGGNEGNAAAIRLRAFTEEQPDLLYNFDVEIAAIVTVIPGEANLDPIEYVRGSGWFVFYPFLREAVANLTMKGRFGPVWLKPVNIAAAAVEAEAAAAKP